MNKKLKEGNYVTVVVLDLQAAFDAVEKKEVKLHINLL